MAIQFNCPYCTTQIRVPDSAGGKRGTCPRCRAKILVPRIAVKSAEAGESKGPPPQPEAEPKKKAKAKSLRDRLIAGPQFAGLGEAAATPVSDVPAFANPPAPLTPQAAAPSSSPAPPLPVTAAISSSARETATPYARALRRRRRSRRFVWVPILFGLLLVGGAAVFFVLTGRKKLEGTLEAVMVPEANLPPRTVSDTYASVDQAKIARVLKHLQQDPLGVLRSDLGLMKHEVTASSSGLSVAVLSTDSTQFYRVDIRKDRTLREFLREKGDQLDRPRIKELEGGLTEFYRSSFEAVDAGGSIPKDALETLRSRVIINSLVGPAGYHLLASVRGQLYLCMYEDDRGRLYYLLPRDTKKFTIVGRTLSDGSRLFPGKYTVDVEGTLESKPADETKN